ncbi:DUF1833 family protein [Aestuariibius sp. 2305UL40-4]|uniref:DUF1833 family protein n=1 Tax=Aestuariibius violaceus TaxID=3234132 RepID=UPI00345EFCA0
MTLTPVARQSIDASETAEVWLVLVDLSHPDWTEDIHLVHNTEPIVSNGITYQPYPLSIVFPERGTEDGIPFVGFAADNASLDVLSELRSAQGPITVDLCHIIASDPDTRISPLIGLEFRVFAYDVQTISGQIVASSVREAAASAIELTPSRFPALF